MIKRVELSDFISHRDSKIEFGEGVTVFIGKNGSGKSSVIDAITYALYGEHTRNSNRNIVRHGASKAVVILEFTHKGKRYRVERKVDSKGNLESAVLKYYDGDKLKTEVYGERRQFGESISKRIEEILGLDYDKMRVAGIIQQGEIDRIIEYKPKEFKELINNIIGIDRLDYAYERMRDVIDGFRERLRREYGYDDLNIPAIQKELDEQRALVVSISKEIERQKVLFENVKASRDLMLKEYEGLKLLKAKYDELNLQVSNLYNYLSRLRDSIGKEIRDKMELIMKVRKCITIASKEESIVSELNRIEERIEEIGREVSDISREVAVLEERKKNARDMLRVIKDGRDYIRYVKENYAIPKILEEKRARLDEMVKRITSYIQEISRMEGLLECSRIEIKDNICPICKNRVSNAEELARELAGEREVLAKAMNEKKREVERLERERVELERRVRELEDKARRLDTAREFLKIYTLDESNIDANERELLSIIDQDIKGLKDKILVLMKEKDDLIKRKREYTNKYNEMIEAKAFLKDKGIESLDAVDRLSEEIKEKERIYNLLSNINVNEKIDKFAIDDYSRDLIGKIQTLREESKGFSEERFHELEGNIKRVEEDMKKIEVDIKSLENDVKKINDNIEEMSKVKDILDYARRYINTLESIRNNVFYRDGKVAKSLRSWALEYISRKASEYAKLFDIGVSRVELREKDNAIEILCYGKRGVIDIHSMSGGERVALGLALRFGIAYVMGGYKLDFIILDEPTVHLDEEKRSAMVELISTLADNSSLQMIVITHDSEIFESANVDNIYRFEMSEQGTRISNIKDS